MFLSRHPASTPGRQQRAACSLCPPEVPLLLPSKAHLLRQLIDDALLRARATPEVVSEIESVPASDAAVLDGPRIDYSPASVVTETSSFSGAQVRALTRPSSMPLSRSVCPIIFHYPNLASPQGPCSSDVVGEPCEVSTRGQASLSGRAAHHMISSACCLLGPCKPPAAAAPHRCLIPPCHKQRL